MQGIALNRKPLTAFLISLVEYKQTVPNLGKQVGILAYLLILSGVSFPFFTIRDNPSRGQVLSEGTDHRYKQKTRVDTLLDQLMFKMPLKYNLWY